jgi:phage tail sheath gpL-like
VTPRTLEPNAQRLKRREVTQMSKTKKLVAAALAVLAIAAVPSTSVALSGSGESVRLACGTSGSTGCG